MPVVAPFYSYTRHLLEQALEYILPITMFGETVSMQT